MEEAGKLDAYTGAKMLIDLIAGTVMCFDPNDLSLSKDEDSNLTFCVNRCPGAEVCNKLRTDGIKRVVGEECQTTSMISLAVEFLLGKTVDYKVVNRGLSASSCKMKARLMVI